MARAATAEIDLGAIEAARAAGPRCIHFTPALEAQFEADTGEQRSRYLILCGLFGLLVYNVFLISDYTLLPDVFPAALALRLGIVTPIAWVVLVVFSRNPPPWLREGLAAAMMLLVMTSAVYLVLESQNPLATYAHYPFILVIIYSNVIQRLRFGSACVASIASLIIYSYGISQLGFQPHAVATEAILTMLSTVVLTLLANYHLECNERSSYLVGLRERLRRQQLTRANEELRVISNLDALTGLTNRRGLDLYLHTTWEAAGSVNQPLAVVMFDVDQFKRFNDRLGHLAGDECLKSVADAARQQNWRASDLIARFGGEEFVVVLPGANLIDGIRAGERIRRAVETCAIPHQSEASDIVTVSVGVAAAIASEVGSPLDLIEAADAALYQAKKNGRNCVFPSRDAVERGEYAALLGARGKHTGLSDAA